MKRLALSCLGILSVLCLASGVTRAADTYTLSFDGPDSFSGAADATVSGSYTVNVSHEGDGPGAQGWSISMTADNATITAIDDGIADQSTTAGELFSGGFSKTELTPSDGASIKDCEGKAGAVSAVVLSFVMPIVLPPNATSSIAKLELEATIPAGGGTATLRFADGCRGAGQPVDNNITQEGATVIPVLEAKEIALNEKQGPINCCGAEQNLGFSAERLASSSPDDGFLDESVDPDTGEKLCNNSGATIEAGVDPVTVYAGISTNGGDGVQGWSFSIEVTGDVDITDATTAGTSGGPAPDGKQSGGFEKTEVVDPAKKQNGGRRGAVSAVVLSFTMPITLDNPGTESVLALTVAPVGEVGEEPVSGKLQFVDGLVGSGQPVNNVLTVSGASGNVCNFTDKTDPPSSLADVTVAFSKPAGVGPFLRGDSNNDGKVNIADPIWTISELFRDGPASPCQAAADSNGDDTVDLGDAVFTIQYRFLGGDAPPAPFPSCDIVPADSTTLSCESSSCP